MDTCKLPKGVKVYDQSGKCWRGVIPASLCPEKYKAKEKKGKLNDSAESA